MGARLRPPQSTCSLALMHLTRGHYARSWGYRVLDTSNAEVRGATGCSPLSHLVTNRRLRLFGHIACSSSRKDHHRAFAAAIRQVLPDWKWPIGKPKHTWLRAIEADRGPLNFGLATAWRKVTTRDEWWHIVNTATFQRSMLWKKKERRWLYQSFVVFWPNLSLCRSILKVSRQ